MPTIMTEDEIRNVAKARTGFKIHLVVYLLVNAFLALIWFVTTGLAGDAWRPANYWPIWPHLGWGLGLSIHGFVVYGGGLNLQRREEEKLRRKYGQH